MVVNDFPARSFPRTIRTCVFEYPQFTATFVLQLFQLSKMQFLNKKKVFSVRMFAPHSQGWIQVRDVQERTKGRKCTQLINHDDEKINNDADDVGDDGEFESNI